MPEGTLNYRPANAYVGDVIPFFWRGRYHAFYLLSARVGTTVGLDWAHVVSDDLVHWQELPLAIARGEPGEPDHAGVWTGSVIEKGGTFHIFYTGWVPDSPTPQTICHATSEDLVHWRKDPANPILKPDPRWYDMTDWRDPFVTWNDQASCYWMLITSRRCDTPWPRRGCLALATSSDLDHWEMHPPLWRPDLAYAPECSDLFCDDGQWTLIYSWGQTRLRRAPSLEGPWTAPAIDSVDGHPFYAAKTLHDGRRRILLGWIALREGETDDGRWRWGGRMGLPRELGFDADGNVRTRPVDEVVKAFARLVFSPKEANAAATNASAWKTEGKDVVVDAAEGALHLCLADLPATCLVTCRVQFSRMAASGGLLLRMSEGADAGYSLMVEPARQRVVFRRWNEMGRGEPLIDRPLRVEAGRWVRMQVFMQDTVVEVFLDDRVALSCRMYDRRSGWLGLLAQNGRVRFADLAVRAME